MLRVTDHLILSAKVIIVRRKTRINRYGWLEKKKKKGENQKP
jgi:hypothetical protein